MKPISPTVYSWLVILIAVAALACLCTGCQNLYKTRNDIELTLNVPPGAACTIQSLTIATSVYDSGYQDAQTPKTITPNTSVSGIPGL